VVRDGFIILLGLEYFLVVVVVPRRQLLVVLCGFAGLVSRSYGRGLSPLIVIRKFLHQYKKFIIFK